jgi:hypothetical protein
MHTTNIPSSSPVPPVPCASAAELVLRQARKLHRAAASDNLAFVMPALRRVHAAGVFPDRPLSTLYRERRSLRRKHFLRALAIEAGFPDWERLRPKLDQMRPESFDHFKLSGEWFGLLNTWFPDEAQARAFAHTHGGRVLRFGSQALVVAPDAKAASSSGSAP